MRGKSLIFFWTFFRIWISFLKSRWEENLTLNYIDCITSVLFTLLYYLYIILITYLLVLIQVKDRMKKKLTVRFFFLLKKNCYCLFVLCVCIYKIIIIASNFVNKIPIPHFNLKTVKAAQFCPILHWAVHWNLGKTKCLLSSKY